jgi:hypothetical protein
VLICVGDGAVTMAVAALNQSGRGTAIFVAPIPAGRLVNEAIRLDEVHASLDGLTGGEPCDSSSG